MVLGGTGGVKIGTVFLKKLGSDLVVQSLVKAILHRILRSIIWAWSQGGRFLWGLVRGGFLYFLLGGTGRGQNVLKISRKATEIIEKSTENQLKPKKTNGF